MVAFQTGFLEQMKLPFRTGEFDGHLLTVIAKRSPTRPCIISYRLIQFSLGIQRTANVVMADSQSSFRPALLVVDMQEDFCPPSGSLAVPLGRTITPLINTLLTLPPRTLPLKIATQDWHPPNHISFAPNHPSNPPPFVTSHTITNPLNPSQSYTTLLWPPHCIQSTPGASLIPELSSQHFTHIIKKGLDPRVEMYSAFFDPFPPTPTGERVCDSGLAKLLHDEKVTHVYVVGLAGDYCVKHTAYDATKEGFQTVIIEEGTKTVNPGGWEECKKEMESIGGVRVVSVESEEVQRLFKKD
ncbi:Oxidase-like protein [Podospora pseudocomata]|uniref:nicotinamidase n=1 Tax=Podospora pseudocomata TaxID=2093779 RepID=A0ABR0GSZ8_9PEZI|nr:Oxidase-like protein [Podospora pseudocomata]